MIMLFLGFLMGLATMIVFMGLHSLYKTYKFLLDNYNIFDELLTNINSNKTKFISRYNDIVSLSTKISIGSCRIDYLISEKKVYISIKNEYKYTSILFSHLMEKNYYFKPLFKKTNIINDICLEINSKFNSEINDTIVIMNNTFDKKTILDRVQKLKIGDFIDITNVDKKEEERQYTIDEILDRINEVGMKNLTEEEKNFLKNYQNNGE